MLTQEENELLVRTGPGTPMGSLIRRYWIPALFCDKLPRPDCPPVRVRLLGEDLIAWRSSEGTVGLVEERCPHRGARVGRVKTLTRKQRKVPNRAHGEESCTTSDIAAWPAGY